jgi:tRNA pseudouridine38-40 synthase
MGKTALTPNNFKLTIEYDGSGYHGWQRQKNQVSIQAEIERALEKMLGHRVPLIGSGRTDAGVHALGQTANFRCDTRLDAGIFLRGLNSLLPAAVVIKACEAVPEGFHARYDAVGKTYRYRILNRRLPAAVGRQYAWHVRRPLDLDGMRRAAGQLVGCHDFKAFEGTGSPRAHTIRTVRRAELHREETDYRVFEIEADGFLKFMVRNIVGTLVEIGMGRMEPAAIESILTARDRSRAGATAPAHGLFLVSVAYG